MEEAKPLTVNDLIAALQSLEGEGDSIVLLSADPEGNRFHTVDGVEPDLGCTIEAYGVEIAESRGPGKQNAILIWPLH